MLQLRRGRWVGRTAVLIERNYYLEVIEKFCKAQRYAEKITIDLAEVFLINRLLQYFFRKWWPR